MDRITGAMLKDFVADNSLEGLKEQDQFEHFVTYATVQSLFGETFDTADIVLGNEEPGIDGVAVIVNGTLVTDLDGFKAIADVAASLDVTFIFVQADRGASFDSGKMATIAFAVRDFFKEVPELPQSADLKDMVALQAAIYEESGKFKKANPACHIFYVTTGQWTGDQMLEARRKSGIAELESQQIFSTITFDCVGADGLQRLYRQTKNAVSREFSFGNAVAAPEKIPGVKEAYLGFLPAKEFLSIIRSEDGEIMRQIFESNIRDFQGSNPVNDAIKDTLQSDHRARFALMNNGVTVIARVLRRTSNRFHIEDFQVVNGCQTSNVLFEHQDGLDDVVIPLRLISSDDEDVIQSIVTATNQQTQLSREQLFAATKFPKLLEQFFMAFEPPERFYYERRSRQYERQSIEKAKIITQANMIRAFAGMFLEEPHRTTRNFNSLLDKVGKEIFVEGHKLDPYYVAAFALYRLERLFRAQGIDSTYKAARFQILLAFRRLANSASLPNFGSKDMQKYCAVLLEVLKNQAAAEQLLKKAAAIVLEVTGGNMHRDSIRTVTVTDALKAYKT